jgi:hypothetical protein
MSCCSVLDLPQRGIVKTTEPNLLRTPDRIAIRRNWNNPSLPEKANGLNLPSSAHFPKTILLNSIGLKQSPEETKLILRARLSTQVLTLEAIHLLEIQQGKSERVP